MKLRTGRCSRSRSRSRKRSTRRRQRPATWELLRHHGPPPRTARDGGRGWDRKYAQAIIVHACENNRRDLCDVYYLLFKRGWPVIHRPSSAQSPLAARDTDRLPPTPPFTPLSAEVLLHPSHHNTTPSLTELHYVALARPAPSLC